MVGDGEQERPRSVGAVLSLLGLWLSGCMAAQPGELPFNALIDAPAHTLVNLHPNEETSQLSSWNYQRPALIPHCTRVDILYWTTKEMRFVTVADGRRYQYLYHPESKEAFGDHLMKYFGHDCDPDVTRGMSDVDRESVRLGVAHLGMTKPATILALGYPPRLWTPSLEADRWHYARDAEVGFTLVFDERGVLTEILE